MFALRGTLCTQDKSSRRQRESKGVPLPHSHHPLFQHCHLLSIFSQHWGHNSLRTVSLLGPTWCVGPGTDFPTCFCPQLYQTRVRERTVDKDRVQVCGTQLPQAPRHTDISLATLQHQKQTSTRSTEVSLLDTEDPLPYSLQVFHPLDEDTHTAGLPARVPWPSEAAWTALQSSRVSSATIHAEDLEPPLASAIPCVYASQ